ncbi:regulator of microtubule dynamics protein 1-like [Lineus longissimus]|uniref:regulator of microtubule dynamics protein 1-like n=1 Tax=Lineus longissimus TaxID=88925 RepID=UPI00315D7BF7
MSLMKWRQFIRRGVVLVPGFAALRGFTLWSSTKSEPEKPKNACQIVIDKADELYSENKMDELYALLIQHATCENAEALWRLARAAYEQGQHAKDSEKKKKFMYEAYQHILKAMTVDDKNFAVHKWYAILLDIVGEYEGTRKRIENSYIVKEHFEKAVELNPTDATSVHTLGYWHFLFADLPWYQRKIASVVFATPPASTYEEALELFLKAEKIEPNFYSTNLLMIGKCYMRLSKKEEAIAYLIKARNYLVKNIHDQKAHDESKDLLLQLGVTTPDN